MTEIVSFSLLTAFIASFVVVALSYSRVRRVAVKRNVVDNPNARKLQKEPVPVMGGVAVFIGLLTGLCVVSITVNMMQLLPVFVAMSLMLCVGVMDDVSGLSPWLRFFIEIMVVVMLIVVTGTSLNNLHGLWGAYHLPLAISVPLTIFAVVGMINALNLIDGVDGLLAGFCIMASIAFGVLFYHCGLVQMVALSAVTAGSLLPFFLHNVFGARSKMFIGDGGSLMMGVVMSSFVVVAVSLEGEYSNAVPKGVGLVPFTMAVMAVPVFDTLRVMTMRIVRGVSPFHPDKTHLHHLFIDLGYSHIGTTLSVLSLNFLVMAIWWVSYKLGASVDVQFYIVVACSFAVTSIFYKFVRVQMAKNGAVARLLRKVGEKSHFEKSKAWGAMQRFVDGK